MNNIFIPFKDYLKDVGGPSTFMRNLYDFLITKKFDFTSNPGRIQNTNGIFFPISYDKYILAYFKENKLPIIQRLDGIYYPSKHGKQYEELNRDIKDIYLNYSTHVIFQSLYCIKQCFGILGEIPEDKYSIIYNGANHDIFYPQQEIAKNNNSVYKLVTTGNFRNIDMLEPIIIALDHLANDYNFDFTIVGPVTNKKLKELIKNKRYIKNIRRASLNKVANILRSSNIFLYSHLNPPCPNSVIEAISCGLPVLGFDSGSMSDLLFFAKDLLAPVSNKTFQEYNEFSSELLKEKIIYTFENLYFIKKRALKYSYLYSFKNTANQYIKIFNQLLSNN